MYRLKKITPILLPLIKSVLVAIIFFTGLVEILLGIDSPSLVWLGAGQCLAAVVVAALWIGDAIKAPKGIRSSTSADRATDRPWRRSPEFLAGVFNAAPIGMARLTAEGRLREVNRILAQDLGLEGYIDFNKTILNFTDWIETPEEARQFNEQLQRMMNPPLTLTQNHDGAAIVAAPLNEITLKTEPKSSVRFYLLPLVAENSAPEFLLYLIEITAYKDLELQILQSRKMQAIGQLAGGIAHDFNNLLTAIIGFGDLLLQRHGPGDDSFSDLTQIKQNATRAADLVRQLLAFSRQQTLRPSVLDLSQSFKSLMQLLQRLIGQTIDLRLLLPPDLGLVKVDPGQMEQVIINLVVNARDAMSHGGVITIRANNITIETPIKFAHETMPPGDFVQIDVIDNGSGISEKHIERIFDPFFTTKPVGSGTGLGLSTVWGIVRQTGGFITVVSEIGRGSSFTVYLPRFAGVVAEAEAAAPILSPPRGKGRILLVEDEAAVRSFAVRSLQNRGYEVFDADGGEAALELLETINPPPDMLITDAVMPGMDGPGLIHQIRQTYPSIRVLCISGHSDEALRKRINDFSDVKFLAKPFSLNDLIREVQDSLDAN
ncbi:MAG: response regulator [Candidatus Pacebacteria bacterium]|nr:response regulator [Candidatus Paceibacterota bacterium]